MEYLESQKVQRPVYLNVYSFLQGCNAVCSCLGLGVYHTAIEINGIEYMFHGFAGPETGVTEVEPRSCPYLFEERVLLGHTHHYFHDLETEVVRPLEKAFISDSYDLLGNNCNHFSLAMAQSMGLSQHHPTRKIFRVTDCLNRLRCCIPDCILSGRLDWFKEQEEKISVDNCAHYSFQLSGGCPDKYWSLIEEDPVTPYALHSSRESMDNGDDRKRRRKSNGSNLEEETKERANQLSQDKKERQKFGSSEHNQESDSQKYKQHALRQSVGLLSIKESLVERPIGTD